MYCTTLFAAALAVMVTGGITAFLLNRRPAAASAVGCMTMTLGGLAAGYCTAGNGPMVFFQFPIISQDI